MATGKRMMRIERAIVSYQKNPPDNMLHKMLNEAFKGTLNLTTQQSQLTDFLKHSPLKTETLNLGGLFIVDPHSNVILTYPLETDPEKVLKDLKHLLKISQIG